jgi:glycosyltransferase involved in cell wall biosynthesis
MDDSLISRKNISMVVWNSFLNDARVLKEAQTLQSAGYKVTVFALHTPGVTKKSETTAEGIKIVRIARSPLWTWRKKHLTTANGNAQAQGKKTPGPIKKSSLKGQLLLIIARSWTHSWLVCQLVRSKPDLVHSHDVNTLPTAWLASVIARVPLVYDAHEISTDREGYTSFRKVVGWIEKRLMPRAAGTITTTDTRAKFFARAYGISRPLVLQNRPRYLVVERSERIRNDLNLQETWPIVLYQGGLQQGRGLERIIDVAQEVKNAYFVFVGGGRLEPKLKEQTGRLNLKDRVYFIDTVSLDDLPYYTASADIGVQAIENTCLNHFSTDSNKVFEYVMGGLPVISSNLPEIRKLMKKHGFGVLVEAGSNNSLKEAIQQLVDDKILRDELSRKSSTARLKLNWEDQESKLIDFYLEISQGC